MTNLNRALVEIRSIRRQVAQSTQFRGYGPLTLSATALLALVAGIVQARYVARPALHPEAYVALWLATAALCAGMIAAQMYLRTQRLHAGMADAMLRSAVAEFAPAAVAGLLLPFIMLHADAGLLWMLPGLWQTVFSLGVFSCCRTLPRPLLLVGVWFFICGFACLWLGGRALAPAGMAAVYAIGMGLAALIHFRSSGRSADGEEAEL